jgi:hypothetical protein
VLCLAGPTAEYCASEVARWPSDVAHKRLPSVLTYLRVNTSLPLHRLPAAGAFLRFVFAARSGVVDEAMEVEAGS